MFSLRSLLPVFGVLAILLVIAAACFIVYALFMETGQCFTRACQQNLMTWLVGGGVGSSVAVLGVSGYIWLSQKPWQGQERRRHDRRKGDRREAGRRKDDVAPEGDADWSPVEEPKRRKSD